MAGPTFGGESKVRAPRRPESRGAKLTRAWALGSDYGHQMAPRLSPLRDVSMGIALLRHVSRVSRLFPLSPLSMLNAVFSPSTPSALSPLPAVLPAKEIF